MNGKTGKKVKTSKTEENSKRPQGSPISQRAADRLNEYFREENGVLMMRNINVSAVSAMIDEEANELFAAIAQKDGPEIVDALLDMMGAACLIIDGIDSWVVSETINNYLHSQATRNRMYRPHMAVIQKLVSTLANGRQGMMTFEGMEYSSGVTRGESTTRMLEERSIKKAYAQLKATAGMETESAKIAYHVFLGIAINTFGVNLSLRPDMEEHFTKKWESDQLVTTTVYEEPSENEAPVEVSEPQPEQLTTQELSHANVIVTNARGSGFMGGIEISLASGTNIGDATTLPLNVIDHSEFSKHSRQLEGKTVNDIAKLKTAINKVAKADGIDRSNPDGMTIKVTWPKPTKMMENSTMIWNHTGSKAQIVITQGGSANGKEDQ